MTKYTTVHLSMTDQDQQSQKTIYCRLTQNGNANNLTSYTNSTSQATKNCAFWNIVWHCLHDDMLSISDRTLTYGGQMDRDRDIAHTTLLQCCITAPCVQCQNTRDLWMYKKNCLLTRIE